MWRQPPLDLIEDSHRRHKEQPKTWLGFSLLYLGQNIKPYTSKGLRLSWKILQKNILPEFQSVKFNSQSIEQADLHGKSCSNSIPTLHKKHILWASLNKNKMFWSWFANITKWSSNTLVPNSLEPNELPLWQSVIKHKLKQNAQSLQKTAHYKNIAQHNKFNLTTIYQLQV